MAHGRSLICPHCRRNVPTAYIERTVKNNTITCPLKGCQRKVGVVFRKTSEKDPGLWMVAEDTPSRELRALEERLFAAVVSALDSEEVLHAKKLLEGCGYVPEVYLELSFGQKTAGVSEFVKNGEVAEGVFTPFDFQVLEDLKSGKFYP